MNEQSSIKTEPRAAPTTGDENGYSDGYFAVGVKPQQIYDSEVLSKVVEKADIDDSGTSFFF